MNFKSFLTKFTDNSNSSLDSDADSNCSESDNTTSMADLDFASNNQPLPLIQSSNKSSKSLQSIRSKLTNISFNNDSINNFKRRVKNAISNDKNDSNNKDGNSNNDKNIDKNNEEIDCDLELSTNDNILQGERDGDTNGNGDGNDNRDCSENDKNKLQKKVSEEGQKNQLLSDSNEKEEEEEEEDDEKKHGINNDNNNNNDRVKPFEFIDKKITTKLELIPFETTIIFNESDNKIRDYLSTVYQNEISKFEFFPKDIIFRFTMSQSTMDNYNERLQKTCEIFEQYLHFHETYKMDTILYEKKYNTKEYINNILSKELIACPFFFYGLDKMGHPIFWDRGTSNASIIYDIFTLENGDLNERKIGLLRARFMRKMANLKIKLSKYYQTEIFQHLIIIDLSQLSVSELIEQCTKNRHFHETTAKQLTDLFPETCYKLILINTPWAFRLAWKIISNFLDPVTVGKAKVLGSDYLDELKELVDINMLPKEYGGNGVWDIRIGDVPKDFPFQANDALLPLKKQ